MSFNNPFSRTSGKEPVNFLTLTPVALVAHEIAPEGHVRLLIPRFTSTLGKKLMGKRFKDKPIRMNFDELGSAVWLLIDGKRKVGAICDELQALHEGNLQEVELRVTRFLNQLFLNKYVTFKELNTAAG